jgi:hypothetical protein
MQPFRIYTRTRNDQDWVLYGTFNTESEWERELAHVKFLRSIGPLYIKRETVRKNKMLQI